MWLVELHFLKTISITGLKTKIVTAKSKSGLRSYSKIKYILKNKFWKKLVIKPGKNYLYYGDHI